MEKKSSPILDTHPFSPVWGGHTHRVCPRCNGTGAHLDTVRWSDGLGIVNARCKNCDGTGVEPSKHDLRARLEDANQKAHWLYHGMFLLLREMLYKAEPGTLPCNWNAMDQAWRQVNEGNRNMLARQTGKIWCTRRNRVIEAPAEMIEAAA